MSLSCFYLKLVWLDVSSGFFFFVFSIRYDWYSWPIKKINKRYDWYLYFARLSFMLPCILSVLQFFFFSSIYLLHTKWPSIGKYRNKRKQKIFHHKQWSTRQLLTSITRIKHIIQIPKCHTHQQGKTKYHFISDKRKVWGRKLP